MSQAEWMLVVTLGSLVGVTVMGLNLAVALWRGEAPRPVPLTTWLGILVLAASVLGTRWDEDEASTIIAAVATAEPICSLTDAVVHVETYGGGARLDGATSGSGACHIWAVIEDPRTGTLWLQGPASAAGATWSLKVSLAMDDATSEQLAYRVSVAVVDPETHEAWLRDALASDGIVSLASASANGWLARGIPV